MLTEALRRKLPHLIVLNNSCSKVRKAILSSADNELITVLSSCVLNAISNPQVRLSSHCIKKLKPFKKTIRQFASAKVSKKEKKSILRKKQVGGWLIPIVSSLLSTVIPYIVKKFTGNQNNTETSN